MFLLLQSTHRMLMRYHPVLGHLFVPNLRARLPNDEGGYFLVTNSDGFRSDIDFEKGKSGRPRILMFGDSYTAGDLVPNEDRYSDVLARLLDADVYNFGLSGSGTDQHLLIYQQYAREVDADLVVICVQIDSIQRIQVSHRESLDRITRQRVLAPKPYFTLEQGRLVLNHVPVPRERPAVGSVNPETLSETRELRERDWRQSLLSQWRDKTNRLSVPPPFKTVAARMKSEAYRLSGVQPYPDFSSWDTPGWQLMKAILEEFVSEVAPRPVLIVPIPTWEFYRHAASPVYQSFFNKLADPARQTHVLDVSTPLLSLPWSTRQKLAFSVGHFTAFGHDTVGHMMAAAIRDRGLLPVPTASAVPTPSPRPVAHKPRAAAGSTYVLGLSCFYHNSAACLLRDGEIVAAAEEERFTRVKNDRRFPHQSVNFCLEQGGVNPSDLAAVAYYDNAALTFERILHTQLATAADEPANDESWLRAMPGWIRYKLHIPQLIRNYLHYDGKVLQGLHHRSHGASAFYPSPHSRAAILTIDGVGEWATASIGVGCETDLRLLQEMRFPNSLGLLYSAFTQFTGFKVNSGEYKLMGLAPYGQPTYARTILDHIIDLKNDGSLTLNLEYFDFLSRPTMTSDAFAALFGGPARKPESRITRRELDLARSIQVVLEEAVLRMARHAHQLTGGEKVLCLAGGVALNCVANGRLLREGPFEDIWIQPAAGDSGCALGVAYDAYHGYLGQPRVSRVNARPPQGGSYWGPEFSDDEIRGFLDTHGYPARRMSDGERADVLARALMDGKVVGHLAGRMEYGPRSLGSRSILGDARNTSMQADLNLKIKYRESFRPFAPSVVADKVSDYFEFDREAPYMLIVAPVRKGRRREVPPPSSDDLLPIVRQVRSDIPAVTHVDYSARIQTVAREDHPTYWELIHRFEELTGCAVIVNTSFNVRGEPIVCTPADAYRCFMRTEMNVLALGNYLLLKEDQPAWPEGKGEGLESEDIAPVSRTDNPEALLSSLRRLFQRDVVPLAIALKRQESVRVSRSTAGLPSTWERFDESRPLRQSFEFSPDWDASAPNADALAGAIASVWTPGPAREAIRPLLTKLVALGLRYPPKEALEEEVSESVYVMY
jgi:carbamoyltransferase